MGTALVVNNFLPNVLANVSAAEVFLGNIAGRSADGFDHLRLLGDNKFAFEDLRGGGDHDFNDTIAKAVII